MSCVQIKMLKSSVFSPSFVPVPEDLSLEERDELSNIRRRKRELLDDIEVYGWAHKHIQHLFSFWAVYCSIVQIDTPYIFAHPIFSQHCLFYAVTRLYINLLFLFFRSSEAEI